MGTAKLQALKEACPPGEVSNDSSQQVAAKPSWKMFYDLQCPFSKAAFMKLPEIRKAFGEKYEITTHIVSLAFHPQAFTAHCAAVLMGEKEGQEARAKFEKACFEKQESYMN